MMPRLRDLAPKLALSVGSLFFGYVFCELLVFPFALSFFSYKLQWRVDLPFLVFCQSTKAHRVPKDYTLILGDSYAVGLGEEWDNLDRWTRKPIGAQAVLYAKTGRDIITMGHAGAGSLGAYVADPAGKFAYLNKTVLYKLPPPKLVLAYFYEGNDLDNNIRDLKHRYDGKYDAAKLTDPAYFSEFIQKGVVETDETYKRIRRWHLDQNLVFWKFIKSGFRKLWEVLSGGVPEAQAAPYEGNKFRVGGKILTVGDRLQGPSLELTPDETKKAVYVFERSLAWLRSFFPGVKVVVVYVPSPLSTYDIVSSQVAIEPYHERTPYYPASRVRQNSDLIAREIQSAADRQDCGFLDARPSLRKTGKTMLVHGGTDWRHLTRTGYAALAEAVLPVFH
ncbi:MAG: hypothetical protein WC943_01515 [Elusimicrobiota bacterium]|jgi:hypothetical protein